MKFRIYTKSHNQELLNKTDKSRRFTSVEHCTVVEEELSKALLTKESIVREFLFNESSKLIILSFLIQFAQRHNARKFLSLGAGLCVIEDLLRKALPEDSVVVAVDFDQFFIDNAQRFFPGIIAIKFDFFNDDVKTICDVANTMFDVAFFLNSSYVMDNDEYIRILLQLKGNHVKTVIDFTSTLIPLYLLPRVILGEIKCALTHEDRGKFHGFSRTKNEFRNIYKEAGWVLKEETTVSGYNYVAILVNDTG